MSEGNLAGGHGWGKAKSVPVGGEKAVSVGWDSGTTDISPIRPAVPGSAHEKPETSVAAARLPQRPWGAGAVMTAGETARPKPVESSKRARTRPRTWAGASAVTSAVALPA
ncbi:hypothetical protein AQJ64_18435 [Streptomyces griseoruber]|uniref:Uncharacterized protein n=1 Tax=Streptomyces griseoruber TaxID=1943 RepID=A0A117RCD3_9ACTN|nr:hypothetical protein AQJ64_18435 [Streptomyces griseoruber]